MLLENFISLNFELFESFFSLEFSLLSVVFSSFNFWTVKKNGNINNALKEIQKTCTFFKKKKKTKQNK